MQTEIQTTTEAPAGQGNGGREPTRKQIAQIRRPKYAKFRREQFTDWDQFAAVNEDAADAEEYAYERGVGDERLNIYKAMVDQADYWHRAAMNHHSAHLNGQVTPYEDYYQRYKAFSDAARMILERGMR